LERLWERPETDPSLNRSADPGDAYLLVLVSGDNHLLALGDDLPILTARAFFDRLAAG